MKRVAKQSIARILGWQVRRLRQRHNFKEIAVVGSIGKTSTKLAIASVLSEGYRVRYQAGNYNDAVSVPLIFFGESLPNIFNPLAWAAIFLKNEVKLRKSYPFQAVVVELGTDGPGQIRQFSNYIKADIAVVTAVTPEHMEYFSDLNAVAEEEFKVKKFSRLVLVNKDLVAAQHLPGGVETYGINSKADNRLTKVKFNGDEATFELQSNGKTFLKSAHQRTTEPQLYSICAAAVVARKLGMKTEQIDVGIRNIPAVSGRMQHLSGANGSLIIDDTYNASPDATRAALDTLYRMNSPHKIALLGNMNELGGYSKEAHEQIGNYCNPKQLAQVITIGPDANRFLAPAARARGCWVKTFDDPYTAGRFIRSLLKPKSVVLAKGSQNGVYAEETVKLLLADPSDASKLVRQSDYWHEKKQALFEK